MTSQDDNATQVAYGVSHVDGVTPVKIVFENGVMTTDETTAILFDPSIVPTRTDNSKNMLTATSSTDNTTVAPIVVNAFTGAVLVSY
jgi:hypothetical protein